MTTKTLSLNAREQHARRLAISVGLRLTKGRPRLVDTDPGYMLLDDRGLIVFGSSGCFLYDASLDQIEAYLTSKR